MNTMNTMNTMKQTSWLTLSLFFLIGTGEINPALAGDRPQLEIL